MSLFGLLGVDNVTKRHAIAYPPHNVASFTTGTSATYQATTHVHKYHELVAACDVIVEAGTGASVSVTAGTIVLAGERFGWTPIAGDESLGIIPLDGTAFNTTTRRVSICRREP